MDLLVTQLPRFGEVPPRGRLLKWGSSHLKWLTNQGISSSRVKALQACITRVFGRAWQGLAPNKLLELHFEASFLVCVDMPQRPKSPTSWQDPWGGGGELYHC